MNRTPQDRTPGEAGGSAARAGTAGDESLPRIVGLAPGVRVVDDVIDPRLAPGVDTLEGRIGPLLFGETFQTHYIDMPAGLYVEEHPHDTGSVIYTVRGRWVLCSGGRRHLMRPGSLFRFDPRVPTGYEVPFVEPAFLLIFKEQRVSESERALLDYLEGLANRLEQRHASGTPFLLRKLPWDHPALGFARQVNPDFGRDVPAPPGAR